MELSSGRQDLGRCAQALRMLNESQNHLHRVCKHLCISVAVKLQIICSTVQKVLNITCRLHAFQIQIVQVLKPINCYAFATDILEWLGDKNGFLKHVTWTDDATFHMSGIVNCHNVSIRGSEKAHVIWQWMWQPADNHDLPIHAWPCDEIIFPQ